MHEGYVVCTYKQKGKFNIKGILMNIKWSLNESQAGWKQEIVKKRHGPSMRIIRWNKI